VSDTDTTGIKWLKSSASGTTNCVEVAIKNGFVLIRDSKNPDGSILVVVAGKWSSFLDQIRYPLSAATFVNL
jgi:hypothetical protein